MESDNDNIFIPQVSHSPIPKVGLEFDTVEDAQNFYNEYAREAGFSTRVDSSKKKKSTNEVVWKLFVCSNEGKTNEHYQMKRKDAVEPTGERQRGHTRCGCKARMDVVKQQLGSGWMVSRFIEEHNHGLATPSRRHLLRSHRKVTATKKALAAQLSEANVPTCQQLRIMEIDAGGPSAVGFTEKDIRNHERDRRQEKFGHDAEALIDQFTFEREKNPNFFFDYETDEENKFLRCFWADCESRRAYAYFGDVVVFDTTYNTNKYAMIFAPFVGVNHHGQTVLFGCGLLSNETTESFVWLFSKFLEAMPNHTAPRLIITDQDAAIAKGISIVLPLTFHRFCLWHILNKFPEKINVMLYKEYYHTLLSIIKQSKTPEEFDDRWQELVQSSDLVGNEWLMNMYELRARWVPAYVKHVFAAGMSSSQRSESGHSFFKKYIHSNNSLIHFISRFNRALEHQRHQELVANHVDISERPRVSSSLLIESQMAQIYTKKMFLKFQKEFVESSFYICSKIASSEEEKVYRVERFQSERSSDHHRQVTYITSTDFITCSCRMFEFEGFLCRHMICYMKKKQVLLLPDKYILPRWTKNAKAAPIFEISPSTGSVSGQSLMSRHGLLAHEARELVDDAALTQERTSFMLQEFRNLKMRVTQVDDGGSIGALRHTNTPRDENFIVHDPKPVRAKGCGKRMKSGKEKALSQGQRRQCGICNESGHDKRTCPVRRDSFHLVDEAYTPQMSYDDPQDGAFTSFSSSQLPNFDPNFI